MADTPCENLAPCFKVGEFVADPLRNTLSRQGANDHIEPKVMDVLTALARRAGDVLTREEIIDTVWRVEAGGDESLTRAISLLRKVFACAAEGRDYIETVPKRGYRLTAPVIRLPRAPDETRDGETQAAATARIITPSAKTRLLRPQFAAAAVSLIAAVCAGWFLARAGDPPEPLHYNRIAVADIAPLADDEASKRDATALREGLLSALSLGRVQAVAAANEDKAGLRLVGAYVEPGASRAVAIRIEDRASGATLWSRRYDLGGDAQKQILQYIPWHVAGIVSCGVSDNDISEPLPDSRLVGYFLRGCDSWRTGQGFEPMAQELRQAVAYAPDSIVARLKYAIAEAWLAGGSASGPQRERLLADVRRIAGGIAQAHPDIGRAYYALGIADWFSMNWAGAEKNLQTALRLEPDYMYTYNALASVMHRLARNDETFDLQRLAIATDRFSPAVRSGYAYILAETGYLAEAYAVVDDLARIDETNACFVRFQIDHWWGDARAASGILEDGCVSEFFSPAEQACAKAFLQWRLDQQDARSALNLCQTASAFEPFRYASALGFPDEAVDMAMNAERVWRNAPVLSYPEMRSLRRDPRVMQVAARYGLLANWVETDRWPDFCSAPDLPYDCRKAAQAIRAGGAANASGLEPGDSLERSPPL